MPLTPVSRTDRRRTSEEALATVERCQVGRTLAADALDDARTTQDRCLRQVRENLQQSQTVLARTSGRRLLRDLLAAAGG